jgi:hypothetical protein
MAVSVEALVVALVLVLVLALVVIVSMPPQRVQKEMG